VGGTGNGKNKGGGYYSAGGTDGGWSKVIMKLVVIFKKIQVLMVVQYPDMNGVNNWD